MAAQGTDLEASTGRGAGSGPTCPPPRRPGLSPVPERNIRALQLRRRREEKRATVEEPIADAITRLTGSMRFVYLHVAFFGFWFVAHLGWTPGVPPGTRRSPSSRWSRLCRPSSPSSSETRAI